MDSGRVALPHSHQKPETQKRAKSRFCLIGPFKSFLMLSGKERGEEPPRPKGKNEPSSRFSSRITDFKTTSHQHRVQTVLSQGDWRDWLCPVERCPLSGNKDIRNESKSWHYLLTPFMCFFHDWKSFSSQKATC